MNLLERARGAVEDAVVAWRLRRAPNKRKEIETTSPKLILIESGLVVGNGVDEELYNKLTSLSGDFQRSLATGFMSRGSEVIALEDEKDDGPRVDTAFMAMVKPVFLGRLPSEAYQTLARANASEHEWHDSFQEKREILKDVLPEARKRPLLMTVGEKLCERMGIPFTEAGQNYINMVFVDDTEGIIKNLPYQWKRWFNWMLMTKLGSFKTIVVPYRMENGEVVAHEAVFGTLEGGHPLVAKDQIVNALFPFTTAKKAGEPKILGWEKENADRWKKLGAVSHLIELGKFLGDHRLLSPPILVQDIIRDDNPDLRRWVIKVAKFSRQAEGAFMEYDPQRKRFFVTVSGRFGAVKYDLSDTDIREVIPSFKFKDRVWVIPVEGQDSEIGPSVEAEEFTGPLIELVLEDDKKYGVQLQSVNGYFREDPRGDVAPAIGGVIHLHRWVDVDNLPEDVILVKSDLERFPAVGCGVDRMHEMSKDAMRRATEAWNAGGRKAKIAVFYVPNHGCNIFLFRATDAYGRIPKDTTAFFKELVASGDLRCIYEVPQVVNGDIDEQQKSFIAVPIAA